MFEKIRDYLPTTDTYFIAKAALKEKAAYATETTKGLLPSYQGTQENFQEALNYSKASAQTLYTFSHRQIQSAHTFVEGANTTQLLMLTSAAAVTAFLAGSMTQMGGNHTEPTQPTPSPTTSPTAQNTSQPVAPYSPFRPIDQNTSPTPCPTLPPVTVEIPPSIVIPTAPSPFEPTVQNTSSTNSSTPISKATPNLDFCRNVPEKVTFPYDVATDFWVLNLLWGKNPITYKEKLDPYIIKDKKYFTNFCKSIMTNTYPKEAFEVSLSSSFPDLDTQISAAKFISTQLRPNQYCGPIQNLFNKTIFYNKVDFPQAENHSMGTLLSKTNLNSHMGLRFYNDITNACQGFKAS